MSEGSGDPFGGGNSTAAPPVSPTSPASHQDSPAEFGQTHPRSLASGDTSQDSDDRHPLLDLGGLGSLVSDLIEVDAGAESKIDGTHAAAMIDVDLGGGGAGLSILGGADITGGSGITGGPDNLDASCLLDGLLCDGILS